MFRSTRVCLLLLVVGLLGWLALAPGAFAAPPRHPAPSVLHDYIFSLTPQLLTVQSYLRISPELVPEIYRQIDTNGDGRTSDAERAAWFQVHAKQIGITLDAQPQTLQISPAPSLSRADLLVSINHPVLLTYTVALAPPLQGNKHHILFTYGDSYVGYDEYYVSVAGDPTSDGKPHGLSAAHYPATYQFVYHLPDAATAEPIAPAQLAPPPFTAGTPTATAVPPPAGAGTTGQAANLATGSPTNPTTGQGTAPQANLASQANPATGQAPGAAADRATNGAVASSSTLGADRTSSVAGPVLDTLRNWHGEIPAALGMLLLALGLGALHALSPGHGKAMVAAYLVGTQGRVRDAVLLGGVVTITHTFGVILLGFVLLLLTTVSYPLILQPLLELVSGLLVLGLGAVLLVQRWRTFQAATSHSVPARAALPVQVAAPLAVGAGAVGFAAHGHNHPHEHEHDHEHEHSHNHAHGHAHGGHDHVPLDAAGRPSLRALVGMGVSGGLVPCPDAIAIILLASAVGQVGLGLGLVTSFSLGLAAVLIGIGIALVTMKGALARSRLAGITSNPLWTRGVPLISAGVVILVGLLMVVAAAAGRWS